MCTSLSLMFDFFLNVFVFLFLYCVLSEARGFGFKIGNGRTNARLFEKLTPIWRQVTPFGITSVKLAAAILCGRVRVG